MDTVHHDVEQTSGPDHPRVTTILNNLAVIYEVQDRHSEAVALHQCALAIREQALGADHPAVANSLNNLASLYREMEKYAEAEPLYQPSVSMLEQALGPDHLKLATVLKNYALLLREKDPSLSSYAGSEAMKLETRAQVIRAKHVRRRLVH